MTFFCFNDTATTEIYTLSLHDALPIWPGGVLLLPADRPRADAAATIVAHLRRAGLRVLPVTGWEDRKSTRLNSSHRTISYAVFCLKKKKKKNKTQTNNIR